MSNLDSFSLDLPVKFRFGCGVFDEIQKAELPGRNLMIVAGGRTIRSNGTVDRLTDYVKKKSESIIHFYEISANPTLDTVMRGAAIARENNVDCVIGIGGGSSLDTAKGIAAMAVNEGSLWNYTASGSGKGKSLTNKPLPLIAIPTTAGTGSEGNKTAVITDSQKKEKIGVRTDFPYFAYIDPELTLSVPPAHTAAQGFDAFCHCLEAFLSVKANPMSDLWAAAGMRAIWQWLPEAVENGSDIEARYHVSFGAMLGGVVLYLSSASAAHTMEHMLSGVNPSVSHGGGLAMIFDAFHQKMSANVPQRYAEIADILGISGNVSSDTGKADRLLSNIHEWKKRIGLGNLKLRDYGFEHSQIDEMIRMTHWVGGGPLTRDRYKLTDDDLFEIFENSLKEQND